MALGARRGWQRAQRCTGRAARGPPLTDAAARGQRPSTPRSPRWPPGAVLRSRCPRPASAGGGRGGLRGARRSSPPRSPAATACWRRQLEMVLGRARDRRSVSAPAGNPDTRLIDLASPPDSASTGRAGSAGVRLPQGECCSDDRWAPAPARIWSRCGWPTRPTSTPTGIGCHHASRRRPVGAPQAGWWREPCAARGTRRASPRLFAHIAAGAENPAPAATPTRSPSSPVRRRLHRRSRGRPVARRRCDRHRHHTSRLDDDRLAFYQNRSTATTPVSALPVGDSGQHGLSPTSTCADLWLGNEQSESQAAIHFHQRTR